MFDIGFLELLVVAVTALLVLGPERLPSVVRQLAQWLAKSRHFANQLKDEFEREANLGEMRASLEKQKREFEAQLKTYEKELEELNPKAPLINPAESKLEEIQSGVKKND